MVRKKRRSGRLVKQLAAAAAAVSVGAKTLEYFPYQLYALHDIRFVSISRGDEGTIRIYGDVFNNLLRHSFVTRERERRYLFNYILIWHIMFYALYPFFLYFI